MAFWSESNLDPKRQFKFYVTFTGLNATAPHWVVKGVNKPTMTIGETAHKYLDKNFYFPGRVEWNTVKFTMVDPVGPSGIDVAKSLNAVIAAAGYTRKQTSDSSQEMATISKQLSTSLLGGVTISQMNSFGTVVEQWELYNAWIKSVNFGQLSYESEDLVNLEMELRYDWANIS